MFCVPDDDGLPIETCCTPPNEILSSKSEIEINLVYIVLVLVSISDVMEPSGCVKQGGNP
jgi:hypothetical protein